MSDEPDNKPKTEPTPVQPPSANTTQSTAAPHAAQPTNGLAITALILGIIAILSGWVIVFGLLVGAAAIVLGILGMKKPGGKGMSITGIITGSIGALTSLIVTALFFIALAAGGAALGQGAAISQALDQQYASEQAQIDAKKDFAKGETAAFGSFEVKVNSVERGYVPEESYYAAGDDEEYVLVNVSVTNKSDESDSFSSYDLALNADGIAEGSYFIEVSPEFKGGTLSPDATASGNLVFKIAKGADTLKLQYETIVYDTRDYSSKTLTYTLGL